MSAIPLNLRYSKNHLWVRRDGDEAVLGITDHAQAALGGITFVDVPEAGFLLTAGQPFGTVESVKTTSDLVAPVSGEGLECNAALEDRPELCNKDPYGDGWIVRIRLAGDGSDDAGLMDAEAYELFCATEKA